MKQAKTYTIARTSYRNSRVTTQSGTLQELIEAYKYTLEVGKSYEHEKGNKKINLMPKTAKSLVTQLNKAVTNSAANGCPSSYFELVE